MGAQVKVVRVTTTGGELVGSATLGARANLSSANLVSGSDAATVKIYDAAVVGDVGTDTLLDEIKCPVAGESRDRNYGQIGGGLHFEAGVWVIVTGTSAVLYLNYV